MARCSCSGTTCGCVIIPGSGAAVAGAGSARDPYVISLAGGEGAESGWDPGDLKDTVRSDTPAGWLECNGQTVARSTYAALFAAIGTLWGAGDGFSTFTLPDFRGRFRMGVGAGYDLGASGGVDQTVLVANNLPAHSHTMAHTHSMAHTHDISHAHGNTSTESALHTHGFPLRFTLSNNTTTGGSAQRVSDIGTGSIGSVQNTTEQQQNHTHAVPNFNGSSGGSSAGSTGAVSVPNTGTTGTSEAFTNLPPYRAVRVLIHT